MLKIDYHMHTNYSFDGQASMDEMIQAAIYSGLTEIALTDHIDYLTPDPILTDYDAYFKELSALREKYPQINIVFGVEIGVGERLKSQIAALLQKHPFEFVIGSTHDINGMDPYSCSEFFVEHDKKTAYTLYFEDAIKSVNSISGINVFGHLDYIERYGKYNDNTLCYKDFHEVIDVLLKSLIDREIGIELNTSGLRYNLGHMHPHDEILKRYRQLGGEIITVGSDAHNPHHIAMHFKNAYETLKNSGFNAVAVFRNRKPIMVDLM